ncbi:MAG: precorrin-8X methylmutase [Cyanobacteria bacterium P01_A01_bin.45]
MEWHSNDAQILASIDRDIDSHIFPPAEYEIVRRVIYATADFEYKSLIHFSDGALEAGATALSLRQPVVVDVSMVKAAIAQKIQKTFINPVYCALDSVISSANNIDIDKNNPNKTIAALGTEVLAKPYPQGIFVIGQSPTALNVLISLIENKLVNPGLIIATPPEFAGLESKKQILQKFTVPHIITRSTKGNAAIASAICEGLIDLAWQVYGKVS